ncbi:uncharacterized protein LOC131301599 [Rhododendron vialii]|uniref:uncharacterized protein LOC131301599 n=1 Tax=Rhododendron vialii TaxID=182163 RepID=UPI00265ED971|nr:uncharacterized protein LOC131301599 [Rhododendron vialii]
MKTGPRFTAIFLDYLRPPPFRFPVRTNREILKLVDRRVFQFNFSTRVVTGVDPNPTNIDRCCLPPEVALLSDHHSNRFCSTVPTTYLISYLPLFSSPDSKFSRLAVLCHLNQSAKKLREDAEVYESNSVSSTDGEDTVELEV